MFLDTPFRLHHSTQPTSIFTTFRNYTQLRYSWNDPMFSSTFVLLFFPPSFFPFFLPCCLLQVTVYLLTCLLHVSDFSHQSDVGFYRQICNHFKLISHYKLAHHSTQHELCTLENHCLLTQGYYFVLPFSFLLFPFSLLTRTYFPIGPETYREVCIIVLYMFWTFIMGDVLLLNI